ncbi:TIGR02757 family protein [Labilibaculum antarcticum]|uniref:TIGR02757 family protein n=1 Tax=Labilibaculum antarcticum TaxID=1717717 RepID=A0A1Y1CJ83_9BACT|nr:TIGR02757 family protein [Labilibaculum antarcticum]BAX80449.1 TIGR02757 family protein [Labilibaculum antarcticum]
MRTTNFSFSDLKEFLEEKYDLYNRESFITTDPIQIPRTFSKKEDVEIAGFLSASIAWGQRPTIIRNAKWLVDRMDQQPHEFILNASNTDFEVFKSFKHRTFNGDDCIFFLKALQNIYKNHGGLENVFAKGTDDSGTVKGALAYFRDVFFEAEHLDRSQKHISNVMKKSAAKRLNMYLRWMVRNDDRGVDFGLWDQISSADLYLPLDVHTGNVGRKLGLLTRKQNDWQAVEEITKNLGKFDPADPIKYDYALFGLGAFEKF